METKQVIVIRKDLKMRRGKEIAQGSHGSMAFLTRRLFRGAENPDVLIFDTKTLTLAHRDWLANSFAKVCLQVNSEQELLDIYNKAIVAKLEAHLVTDAGKTEFNGVPTHTCCAIGPDEVSKIDEITKHLSLY